MNLSTVKWAQWDKTHAVQRTVRSVHMCVHCTMHNCCTQYHNIAQNRPDNLPSYPLDNHRCSDDVYLREGGLPGYILPALFVHTACMVFVVNVLPTEDGVSGEVESWTTCRIIITYIICLCFFVLRDEYGTGSTFVRVNADEGIHLQLRDIRWNRFLVPRRSLFRNGW